ncbi:hypothetical protein CBM2606_A110206 [Cupriavidus taiwanensis]|nr:hypothetical protein CBM2606_A110206 [Cupriavidus taiwanensis]
MAAAQAHLERSPARLRGPAAAGRSMLGGSSAPQQTFTNPCVKSQIGALACSHAFEGDGHAFVTGHIQIASAWAPHDELARRRPDRAWMDWSMSGRGVDTLQGRWHLRMSRRYGLPRAA